MDTLGSMCRDIGKDDANYLRFLEGCPGLDDVPVEVLDAEYAADPYYRAGDIVVSSEESNILVPMQLGGLVTHAAEDEDAFPEEWFKGRLGRVACAVGERFMRGLCNGISYPAHNDGMVRGSGKVALAFGVRWGGECLLEAARRDFLDVDKINGGEPYVDSGAEVYGMRMAARLGCRMGSGTCSVVCGAEGGMVSVDDMGWLAGMATHVYCTQVVADGLLKWRGGAIRKDGGGMFFGDVKMFVVHL